MTGWQVFVGAAALPLLGGFAAVADLWRERRAGLRRGRLLAGSPDEHAIPLALSEQAEWSQITVRLRDVRAAGRRISRTTRKEMAL